MGINALPGLADIMSYVFSAYLCRLGRRACTAATLCTIVPSQLSTIAKSGESFIHLHAVIGGLGSLTGSVLGAIISSRWLPEYLPFSLANYRMPALRHGLCVLSILFKPSACYGYKEFSLKRTIHWFTHTAGTPERPEAC